MKFIKMDFPPKLLLTEPKCHIGFEDYRQDGEGIEATGFSQMPTSPFDEDVLHLKKKNMEECETKKQQ